MVANELQGLEVARVDRDVVERFRFSPDHVSATLGHDNGAVCSPVLQLVILGADSARIHGDGFDVTWCEIKVGPESLNVLRNGAPAEYRIVARHPVGARRGRRTGGTRMPVDQAEALSRGRLGAVGRDEAPRPLEDGACEPGAERARPGPARGAGFHLHPMYLVYVVAFLLALVWDWRALIGLALLMGAMWLLAFIDDRKCRAVDEPEYSIAEGEREPHGEGVDACPKCRQRLFAVEAGVTTATEIASFATRTEGWRDNPEAIAGSMPPGRYCPNGCFAIHATPVPTGVPADPPERVPAPARITLADVLRDGGSYRLDYESTRGERVEVLLRVKAAGKLRRVGYHPPRLGRRQAGARRSADSWPLDWDEAAQLADLLQPLLIFNGDIRSGSARRAREMVLYLRRRGGL